MPEYKLSYTASQIDAKLGKIDGLVTEVATKADISSVPTKTSQLTNDSGFKTTDTTYSVATTSTDGLMSAADKTKLDKLGDSAEVTAHTQSADTITAGTFAGRVNANNSLTDYFSPCVRNISIDAFEPVAVVSYGDGDIALVYE